MGMGLIKAILVIYGPVVVERYFFGSCHFAHILEIPFGIRRPMLNCPFDNNGFLRPEIRL
jgi:hypothetical protein